MADTHIELIGNLAADAEAGGGNRPARFRMGCYVRGTGDEKVTAWVTVKWFNPGPGELEKLTKGKRVLVIGRLDPWTTKDGNQVLDVMAEYVAPALYTEKKDGNGSSNGNARTRQPAGRNLRVSPEYLESEEF